jgi:hypothetical protein
MLWPYLVSLHSPAPYDLNVELTFDVLAVAGLFRASNVLKHYRGFELPPVPKIKAWLDRLFDHPAVKATCSTEELYFDSYERLVDFFYSAVFWNESDGTRNLDQVRVQQAEHESSCECYQFAERASLSFTESLLLGFRPPSALGDLILIEILYDSK